MDDLKAAFATVHEQPKRPASGMPQDMEEHLRRKREWEREFRQNAAWETIQRVAERQQAQAPQPMTEAMRERFDNEHVRAEQAKLVTETFNRERAVCPICGAFDPRISFIDLDGEFLRHFFPAHPSTKQSLREMRERLASDSHGTNERRILGFQLVCENDHQWAMNFHMQNGTIEWETHNVYVPMEEE